jgi:hypothetical protein
VQNEILKIIVLGEDWATIGKIFLHKPILEKIFSQTSRPISIKLEANYLCMKGIQVCLDKGIDPHQKVDNYKMQM